VVRCFFLTQVDKLLNAPRIVHITCFKKDQPQDGSVRSRNMLMRYLIENNFNNYLTEVRLYFIFIYYYIGVP